MHGFVEFLKEGGPAMFINLGVLAFALAVIGERAFSLFLRYGMNDRKFVQDIDQHLRNGNLEAAGKVCQGFTTPALARATKKLLQLLRNGFESPGFAVEESMMEVKGTVSHRVSWLWAIANIATLIGLVGTIFGLISSFKAISAVAADKRADALTASISEAMNNTAFGLSIAVMCIIAHLVLNTKMVKILEGTEHSLFHFLNTHAQWKKGYRPDSSQGAR